MKFLLQTLLFSILAFLFLTSCEDKATSPVKNNESVKDYFPLSVGSWWKYRVELTNLNHSSSSTFQRYDSVYVNRTTIKKNYNTFEVIKYQIDEDGEQIEYGNGIYILDTSYYAYEDKKLLDCKDIKSVENTPIATILDFENQSWDQLSYSFNVNSSFTLTKDIKCTRGDNSSYKYNDIVYPCFAKVTSIDLVQEYFMDDELMNLHQIRTVNILYAKGLGMIHQVSDNRYKVNPTHTKEEKTLISYKIK